MATWAEFATAAPAIATTGRRLLYQTGGGAALLATVRNLAPPRIHPISIEIVEGRLVAFILESPKATDLAEDGRFALHAHQDPAAPSEFLVRGRARSVEDGATRARFAEAWSFTVDDSYRLFEFMIDHAIVGERPGSDDWPPRYTSWRAAAAA